MNNSLAVYIGAGLDLKMIKNMNNITNFVYVDSQPHSEFGLEEYWCRDPDYIFNCFCPHYAPYINEFSRPEFVSELKKTAKQENITLISEEVNKKLTFQYNNQYINYFINLSIPEHLYFIQDDIKNFNHLIISGFFPHYSILNYTKNPVTFWGNINTIYIPEYNCLFSNIVKDTVIYKLNKETLFEKKFNRFNLIEPNGSIKCFRFWENFITYVYCKTQK